MTHSIITPQNRKEQEEIWLSIRKAIAKSSGFHSWQQEREINTKLDLDTQVRRYLEETLETLAY